MEWRGIAEITWVTLGSVGIGLVGFDEFPHIASAIIKHLTKKKYSFETLLFPSKDASARFRSEIASKWDIWLENKGLKEPPESSRYSFLLDPTRNLKVAFLNSSSLDRDSAGFTLDLLASAIRIFPKDLESGQEYVFDCIFNTLKNYNSKFAIPFVHSDDHTNTFALTVLTNANASYTDFRCFTSTVTTENARVASLFIEKRLDLIFDNMALKDLDFFPEPLQLLWQAVEAITIVRSVDPIPAVQELEKQRLETRFASLRRAIAGYPDLIKAIDLLKRKLDDSIDFSSRETYLQSACIAFAEAASLLEPRYIRLSESLAFAGMMMNYREVLESGTATPLPKFGSSEEFMKLLERVFERRGVYPEVPILAGHVLFDILFGRAIMNHDFLAYTKALDVGRKLSSLTASSVNGIQRKNRGSGIRKDQIVLPILTLSSLARQFEDSEEVVILENEARRLLERYPNLSEKFQLCWRDYLRTQDYSFLLSIYKDFQTVRTPLSNKDEYIGFLGHLASSMYEKRARQVHLEKAERIALDMTVSAPTAISLSMSQYARNVSLYFVDLFRCVFRLESEISSEAAKEARLYADALGQELSSHHPALSIVEKTRCLCALIDGDEQKLKSAIESLERHVDARESLRGFIDICTLWLTQERIGPRITKTLGAELDANDPWSNAALNFVNKEIRRRIGRGELFDYDAVVFVEGKIDATIFEHLSKKVASTRRILFIPTHGWTSSGSYARAALEIRLKTPVIVIFDGDTDVSRNKKIKQELVRRLSLPLRRIVTLKRSSIEAYLLVPRCIKAAFPSIAAPEEDIANFIREMKMRRNKKDVLNHVLVHFAGSKYDESAASLLAESIDPEEIDSEIHKIFRLLSKS